MTAAVSTTSKETPQSRLMVAAATLLASRPASGISVREIAEEAGVQHSLIQRHFGTKDELVRQVIARNAAGYLAAIADINDPVESFAVGFDYLMGNRSMPLTLAGSAFSDDLPTGSVQERYPGISRHIELLVAAGATEQDARITAVAVMTMMGGWVLLEDWALKAAGLPIKDQGKAREKIRSIVEDIVGGAVRRHR